MASSNCANCGCQIHFDGKVWVDNSGGDVCGMLGRNDPHVDILEVEVPLYDGDYDDDYDDEGYDDYE